MAYDPVKIPFGSAIKRATHDGRVYEVPAPDVKATVEQLQDPAFLEELSRKGKTVFYPSCTTITGGTKHDPRLDAWKMQQAQEKGVEQARFELWIAGQQGTNVHDAIEAWNKGEDLAWQKTYIEKGTDIEKQITLFDDFEWKRICRYMQWYAETKPTFKALETIVYSHKYKYAGQMDALAEINGKLYVCDWKTSKSISDDYLKQCSAYFHCWYELTGILPDGCMVLATNVQTKKGWRAVYIDRDTTRDCFKKFRNRLDVFNDENEGFEPVRDLLPISFSHSND